MVEGSLISPININFDILFWKICQYFLILDIAPTLPNSQEISVTFLFYDYELMVCRLFAAKPLSELMLGHCKLGPLDKFQQNLIQQFSLHEMDLKMSSAKCLQSSHDISELYVVILHT